MTAAPMPLPAGAKAPSMPATGATAHHDAEGVLALFLRLQHRRRRHQRSPGRPLPHDSLDLLWAGHLSGPR